MKKTIRVLFLFILLLSLSSCGLKVEHRTKEADKEYVELSLKEKNMTVGDSLNLQVRSYVIDNDFVSFSSSDESVVSVSYDGVVQALSKGSATVTATCGDYSDSCNITVGLNGMFGGIEVSQALNNKLSLAFGNELTLDTHVLFNSQKYGFNPVYEIEDESICKIEDGVLKALKIGETYLTISGTWSDEELSKVEILIEVKNIAEFIITDASTNKQLNNIVLYTVDSFDGKTYNKSVTYDVKAKLNGNYVDNALITSEIVDNEGRYVLFNSNTNTISFRSNSGYCYLKSSFTIDGVTYTNKTKVLVEQPVAVYDKVIALDTSTGELPISDIIQTGAVDIKSVKADFDVELIEGKVFGFTVDNEKTQKVTIYNGLVGYELTVIPYTKIIKTAEDLSIFHLSNFGDQIKGYYILANDIDASSYIHENQFRYIGVKYDANPFDGLVGTFDGKGHTISGITLGLGGLFGHIGRGGVVKNVAITGIKFTQVEDTAGLAGYIVGGTLKNVYLQADNLEGKNGQGYRTSLVAYNVDIQSDIQNCIFELSNKFTPSRASAKEYGYGPFAGMCGQKDDLAKANPNFLKNCYVLSVDVMSHTLSGFYVDAINNPQTPNLVGETLNHFTYPNVKRYSNNVEMSQDTNNDYSTFDQNYWDLSKGYPVWKNLK